MGRDRTACGIPDVSYHGENAWRAPLEISSRQLGALFCEENKEDDQCYIAYNMHWLEHSFALPSLPKKKKWYPVLCTAEIGIEKEISENESAGKPVNGKAAVKEKSGEVKKSLTLPERSIILLVVI